MAANKYDKDVTWKQRWPIKPRNFGHMHTSSLHRIQLSSICRKNLLQETRKPSYRKDAPYIWVPWKLSRVP